MYSPAWLHYWAEIFIKHDLRRRIGVDYEVFIRCPRGWLDWMNAARELREEEQTT